MSIHCEVVHPLDVVGLSFRGLTGWYAPRIDDSFLSLRFDLDQYALTVAQ